MHPGRSIEHGGGTAGTDEHRRGVAPIQVDMGIGPHEHPRPIAPLEIKDSDTAAVYKVDCIALAAKHGVKIATYVQRVALPVAGIDKGIHGTDGDRITVSVADVDVLFVARHGCRIAGSVAEPDGGVRTAIHSCRVLVPVAERDNVVETPADAGHV